METYDLSKVTAGHFQDYLGQKLSITHKAGQAAPLKVLKITPLETFSPLERVAFSVVFQTDSSDNHYPQGTYRVNLPSAGMLEIFLVPIGADQSGMKYEAIFS